MCTNYVRPTQSLSEIEFHGSFQWPYRRKRWSISYVGLIYIQSIQNQVSEWVHWLEKVKLLNRNSVWTEGILCLSQRRAISIWSLQKPHPPRVRASDIKAEPLFAVVSPLILVVSLTFTLMAKEGVVYIFSGNNLMCHSPCSASWGLAMWCIIK